MARSRLVKWKLAVITLIVSRHFVIALIIAGLLGITSSCRKDKPADNTTAGNNSAPTAAVDADPIPEKWADKVELDGCPNLNKVSDTLYRGAQPEKEGFAGLEKMGIKTVVCLRRWHDDEKYIKGTNLNYVPIPMNTWKPTTEDVVTFLKTVTNESKQPVFVHCLHGADRTGTMVAIYRIVIERWSKEDAIKEMQQGGFGYLV
jgi:protein tyrosine phosphatase (PTP) superfamily phosphohydrolase (DUF442 family)